MAAGCGDELHRGIKANGALEVGCHRLQDSPAHRLVHYFLFLSSDYHLLPHEVLMLLDQDLLVTGADTVIRIRTKLSPSRSMINPHPGRIWIRIHYSIGMAWIRVSGYGFTPKCHWSATLVKMFYRAKFVNFKNVDEKNVK